MCGVVVVLVASVSFAQDGGASREVRLGNTQVRRLVSKLNGREYELYISPPARHVLGEHHSVAFPVLYVLDAAAMFGLAKETVDLLQTEGSVPPLLLVGITYRDKDRDHARVARVVDFTPTRNDSYDAEYLHKGMKDVHSGGATAFLHVLQREIMPYVDANFSTTHDRGIAGFSFGGLFAVHVLLTATPAFQRYLVGSPSLWWDDAVTLRGNQPLVSEPTLRSSHVFLAAGEDEGPLMLPFVRTLENQLKNSGAHITTSYFAGETHYSVLPIAFSRGVRALYSQPTHSTKEE